MKTNRDCGYEPVGFVDDDRAKVGRRIHGVPVLGHARRNCRPSSPSTAPHEVLIAMPNADPATHPRRRPRARAVQAADQDAAEAAPTSSAARSSVNEIRSLSVEDLLARPPVGLDPVPVQHLIRGRRVMVTGAGGSIGSELCRQIAKLKPASLVMFERYENSLHAIRLELEDAQAGVRPAPGRSATSATRRASARRCSSISRRSSSTPPRTSTCR